MPMNCNLAPEDEPRILDRATGPRREPTVCYECGKDVEHVYGERFCSQPCYLHWLERASHD